MGERHETWITGGCAGLVLRDPAGLPLVRLERALDGDGRVRLHVVQRDGELTYRAHADVSGEQAATLAAFVSAPASPVVREDGGATVETPIAGSTGAAEPAADPTAILAARFGDLLDRWGAADGEDGPLVRALAGEARVIAAAAARWYASVMCEAAGLAPRTDDARMTPADRAVLLEVADRAGDLAAECLAFARDLS